MEEIYTNLKFRKHSQSGKLVGFINKHNKVWRGVNETSGAKKRIILPDVELAKQLKEDVLYKCKLIPMNNKLGFVAVSASAVQFTAHLEVVLLPRTFKILIHFGNTTIVYDPNSSDSRFNSFDKIVEFLTSTQMIENLGEVIEELRSNINTTSAQYV